MFKWRSQISENKNQKSKRLWGKDFSIVKDGLDEKQVVSFVNDLVKQNESSTPSSVQSVLKSAIVEAEQIVSGIKMKAQAEADEEAVRIITQAREEAEKIKGEPVIGAKAEDISSAASEEVEVVVAEAKPEVAKEIIDEPTQLPEETAGEEKEETVQLQEETSGEKVEEAVQLPVPEETAGEEMKETVQLQEETSREKVEEAGQLAEEATSVDMPVATKAEETLEPQPQEEKHVEEEVESVTVKQGGGSLYTGEVEIDIARPVEPKVVSKLYSYLQTTPEIKFVRASGTWDRGTTITVVLDKPVSLISVLSEKIPEVDVTSERPEMSGFVRGSKGLRRIRLVLKKG
ncbi:hypothetical protein ACFLW9_02775 [Chloroflexota bacterium]